MKPKKIEFLKEKETKNTIRFKERQPDDAAAPVIGTLYIPKQTLDAIGYKAGDVLVVELAVAE